MLDSWIWLFINSLIRFCFFTRRNAARWLLLLLLLLSVVIYKYNSWWLVFFVSMVKKRCVFTNFRAFTSWRVYEVLFTRRFTWIIFQSASLLYCGLSNRCHTRISDCRVRMPFIFFRAKGNLIREAIDQTRALRYREKIPVNSFYARWMIPSPLSSTYDKFLRFPGANLTGGRKIRGVSRIPLAGH